MDDPAPVTPEDATAAARRTLLSSHSGDRDEGNEGKEEIHGCERIAEQTEMFKKGAQR
jgi:hypothetical protein